MSKSLKVSARLDPELYNWIDIRAGLSGRTVQDTVIEVLQAGRELLEKRERYDGMLEDLKQLAERGRR